MTKMKIKKIVSLIIVLAISVTGLLVNSIFSAQAANVSTSKIWDLSGKAKISKDTDTDYTKLLFESSNYAEFENKLNFAAFETVLKFADVTTFDKYDFKFTSKAPEGSDETNTVNTLTFSYDGTAFKAKLNDSDEVTLTALITDALTIKQENDKIFVNAKEIGAIKKVGVYTADLRITNGGDKAVSIVITSINKQLMKLNASLEVITEAEGFEDLAPTILFNKNIDDDDFYIPVGLVYTLDYVGCDVLSSTVTTELKYKKEGSADEYKIAKNNKFTALSEGAYSLLFSATDSNNKKTEITKTVNVKADNSAPALSSAFGIAAYKEAVKKAVYKKGTEDTTKEYIYMGSSEYYNIPDFKGLFKDDVSSHTEMKYDMYYNTPSSSGKTSTNVSASALKIALSEEGPYSFKILAIDQLGNRSEYSQLFSFEIYNTQGPQVTAPTSNDKGYVGTSYTSNSFTIKGINITTTYKLYFLNGDNWEKATEELNSLTFKPEKQGKYRIECIVTDNRLKSVKEYTSEIVVDKKKTIIKGDTDWVKNNILSIIFLCTGTLSLIGIIVLLLIKPKEESVEMVDKDSTKKIVSKKEKKK